MDFQNEKYKGGIYFSGRNVVYYFIHLKGQLMQVALRNEIQERISL
jgi:hypothetical protein